MGLSRVGVLSGGRTTQMSVTDFLALPLDHRVRLILEQSLHFYDENGQRLSTADGLRVLKSLREAPQPA